MTTLIATLPKSGTWYVSMVLAAYKNGSIEDLIVNNAPMWKGKIGDGIYMVGHADGTVVSGAYCLDGYTWLNKQIHNPTNTFYIHRNPTDHLVSYHRHLQTHTHSEEAKLGALPLEEFIEKHGLYSYVNHMNSHMYSTKIKYESLIKHPEIHFTQMITTIDPDHKIDVDALLRAIECCSKENIRGIEKRHNLSLGRDQKPGNSHVRSGGSYNIDPSIHDYIVDNVSRNVIKGGQNV